MSLTDEGHSRRELLRDAATVTADAQLLGPGDAAFIPPGVVHASFNAGTNEAHVVAILGPCIGVNGYVSVEVAGEAPWKDLRR